MVQRTSTHIAKSETLMDLALGALYSEEALKNGISTHMADMIFASLPYKILPALQVPVYEEMARRDKDLYDRLEKAGFMLDFGEDGSGLFVKYLRRGSGYYIDVGASELVADGRIKLKRGQAERYTENGIVVDGEELPADLIVLATGYDLDYPFIDPAEINWQDAAPQLYLNAFHPQADDVFVMGMVEASGLGWEGRNKQGELAALLLRPRGEGAGQAARGGGGAGEGGWGWGR